MKKYLNKYLYNTSLCLAISRVAYVLMPKSINITLIAVNEIANEVSYDILLGKYPNGKEEENR